MTIDADAQDASPATGLASWDARVGSVAPVFGPYADGAGPGERNGVGWLTCGLVLVASVLRNSVAPPNAQLIDVDEDFGRQVFGCWRPGAKDAT